MSFSIAKRNTWTKNKKQRKFAMSIMAEAPQQTAVQRSSAWTDDQDAAVE